MTPQRVLNDRYEVGELIGRGGMADVHLGRDLRLGRTVAIKLLRRDLARDPMLQSRFRREATAVAGLNHPAIVAVYDTGEAEIPDALQHEVRTPFIVMEYVAGRTLREMVHAGDLSVADAAKYILGVLAALEYSHRSGIVHRDIKPANVMVTRDDAVKVMDFGIARALADSAATMTQTQAIVGTAQYLSPEQARGETVDARSDLYSAACLFYEMLAGRPPFIGDSPVSVAYQHVGEMPEPASRHNPEVTPALDSVLARALQKDRNDRFPDAAAFGAAIEAAVRGPETQEPGESAATEALPAAAAAAGALNLPAARPSPGAVAAPDQRPEEDHGSGPAQAPDDGPRTRAMAKILAGGPMTTAASPEMPDVLPTALALGNREPLAPERRRHRRVWIVTLVVALVLVLSGIGYAVYTVASQAPARTAVASVPSVTRMSQTDAMNAMTGAHLRPLIESKYDAAVPSGNVISSQPRPGTELAPDSTVTIYVSKGPSSATLPKDLVGQTEGSVRDAIRAAGLVPGRTSAANSATVARDRLIATDPPLGQDIAVGTEVNLMLSTGQVSVPNLIDLPRAEAESMLKDPAVALPYTVKEVENAVVKAGTVTAQSAASGVNVDQGTRMVISVAVEPAKKSPAPKAAKETRPTPTPKTTGHGKSSH